MKAEHDAELTETFDLLADSYRRYILYHLTTDSETVGLDTLVEVLANVEDGHPVARQREKSDTIELLLRHVHLPKLVDAGVITFDADAGIIELSGTNGHGKFIAEAATAEGYGQSAAGD